MYKDRNGRETAEEQVRYDGMAALAVRHLLLRGA